MNDRDAASMRVLYDEHAGALWRYAVWLTGDRARAEDVVQTLLRAWRHPEVFDDSEKSVRAWLFTVARNMIIDEHRTLRFRKEAVEPDGSGELERTGADEVNAALDRLDRRRVGAADPSSPRRRSTLVLPRVDNRADR
jgi:RNA polymerase sigma-70 factor, ECF subfamily